jgi:hypothetical protein
MWTQIVGKLRLALSPPVNHWWHVVLFVTPVGLTTSPMPCGSRTVEISFDFHEHVLRVLTSDGDRRTVPLEARPVSEFYEGVMRALAEVGCPVRINMFPNEVEHAIRFDRDDVHRSYDAASAKAFAGALSQADRVLKKFRSGFIGKVSPVHFFWGSFDLAVTRFSGRTAPPHPGGIPNLPDVVTREAYSHEVSSCGFWPGGPLLPEPIFYAYAYPEPEGFSRASAGVAEGYYHPQLREFVLPYEAVRTASNPDELLLAFLQSTYEAAADLAKWDRDVLERRPQPTGAARSGIADRAIRDGAAGSQ